MGAYLNYNLEKGIRWFWFSDHMEGCSTLQTSDGCKDILLPCLIQQNSAVDFKDVGVGQLIEILLPSNCSQLWLK